jgi:heme o synthase
MSTAADSTVRPTLAYGSTVSDYITLMKPGVMTLVVFTGLAGMFLAPGHLHPLQMFLTVFCIALASGAGGAINMWYDRDIDAVMLRTARRPIPAGRIAPDDALAFGLFLGTGSVMLMGLALNWVAGLLLAAAIAFYIAIYTMWLKRNTPQNIVIGGAAGAFPPMIGWAAVTGDVSLQPLLLFTIIFMWTPPHFWALALYRNGDYARAGVPMMPVIAGPMHTKFLMVIYTWLLVAVTMLLPALGMTGLLFAVSALLLGGVFLFHVYKVYYDRSEKWARKTFGFSILYLFVLFSILMLDGWFLQHAFR